MKKTEIAEILEIYLQDDLNEIISEKSQNLLTEKKEITKNSSNENFIKPINSQSHAISTLAKKSFMINSSNEIKTNQQSKFIPLNEIVEQAKELAKNSKNLTELRKVVENFDGCNLKKMATNTVFCDGNSNSKIMVIGEAPGNHEDLQGIPFCGDSGKLLDSMFASINLTRENFYITNVIFWRPPGNRRPSEEELAICRPFVERHIQLVNPKVLVLVGATSMSAILGITDSISSVRGKFLDFFPNFLPEKIKTFTIFHPSYLMRQSVKKKIAWQDMLSLENFYKSS
jgi:DNA polymerase